MTIKRIPPICRRIFSWEPEMARQARRALVRLGLFPTAALHDTPGFQDEIIINRAHLVDLANELRAEDLRALTQMARLLVLTPDQIGSAIELCQRQANQYIEYWKAQNDKPVG